MIFTEWYRKTFNKEWEDDRAKLYVSEWVVFGEYEEWCRQNGVAARLI